MTTEKLKYSFKDFKSNQEIRWCPGCGDFSILNAVQRALAEMNRNKEDYVFVSGIGCSSRFPYYMNTYGFHGIHGRAGVLSTGVKLANPDLSVWQITGDGDALAIGGNHFIHEIRRNINLNVLLFNNQIYGLTKGQYSPTSIQGQQTKTSPFGTVERPFNPGQLVLGANGNFFARTIDINVKESVEIFKIAESFNGTSVIEIFQNCVIFNNNAHAGFTDKEVRDDNQLWLEHGKPMIYGKNKDKGIVLNGYKLETVKIGENGVTKEDILIHNAKEEDTTIHNALINMKVPDYPIALGVIRAVDSETYDENIYNQIEMVRQQSNNKTMDDIFMSEGTWEVK